SQSVPDSGTKCELSARHQASRGRPGGTSPLLFRRASPGSPAHRSYARPMPTPPEIVYMAGGAPTETHPDGPDPAGAFCFLTDNPPVGWSLPPHIHTDAAETIHVVEGEFEMTIDGRSERMVAGQTVHIPAGVVHSGVNVGD